MPPRRRRWHAIFAILTKVGAYIVLRLWLLLFGDDAGASAQFGGEWLLLGGMATVAFGAIGSLASQDMARLAAFSVLVSSGTVLAAIGMGQVGVTGAALFYLISSTLGLGAFFLLIELVERGREPGADVLAVTREVYGEEDELEESEEVGIAIPATMGILGLAFIGCALVISGLPPLSGFIAKFALLTAALNPPTGAASTASWVLLAGADPVGTGGAYRHDARRHPCVLGFAGPDRTARAADRDGACRRPPAALRNPDDPGRSGHALHAGNSAVAARSSRLYPRRSWPRSRAAECLHGADMTRLIPFPIASASLLVLWLLLNQTLSPGHILLGGAVALVGGWALAALEPPKARPRRLAPSSAWLLWSLQTSCGPTSPSRASFSALNEGDGPPASWRSRLSFAILMAWRRSPASSRRRLEPLWVDFNEASGTLTIHVLDLSRQVRMGPHHKRAIRAAAAGDIRMSTMLAWSVTAAQILLGLAMACATFRILWGPRAQDRVVGFDSLYVNAMLLLLAFGIGSGSTLYFEAALIVALLGFVSTVALAKFLLRGEVIE